MKQETVSHYLSDTIPRTFDYVDAMAPTRSALDHSTPSLEEALLSVAATWTASLLLLPALSRAEQGEGPKASSGENMDINAFNNYHYMPWKNKFNI